MAAVAPTECVGTREPFANFCIGDVRIRCGYDAWSLIIPAAQTARNDAGEIVINAPHGVNPAHTASVLSMLLKVSMDGVRAFPTVSRKKEMLAWAEHLDSDVLGETVSGMPTLPSSSLFFAEVAETRNSQPLVVTFAPGTSANSMTCTFARRASDDVRKSICYQTQVVERSDGASVELKSGGIMRAMLLDDDEIDNTMLSLDGVAPDDLKHMTGGRARVRVIARMVVARP
jgi:hypothetical protein